MATSRVVEPRINNLKPTAMVLNNILDSLTCFLLVLDHMLSMVNPQAKDGSLLLHFFGHFLSEDFDILIASLNHLFLHIR